MWMGGWVGDGRKGDFRRTVTYKHTITCIETLTVNVQLSAFMLIIGSRLPFDSHLSFTGRPTLPTHNCPSWIVSGQTITCRCQTTDRGNPEGTIKWISPGGQTLAFSRSSSVSLHLASVSKSDNGTTFICKAANPLSISEGDSIYSINIACKLYCRDYK